MVLRNFIELQPGAPATFHFTDQARSSREIRDPQHGMVKTLNTLVFQVDELNGQPVSALFSVSSEKLAAKLAPHLVDGAYRGLLFTITKLGSGFLTEYEVKVASR